MSTTPRTDRAYFVSHSDDAERVDALFHLCEELEKQLNTALHIIAQRELNQDERDLIQNALTFLKGQGCLHPSDAPSHKSIIKKLELNNRKQKEDE